jgi:hypothetical protein
MNNFSDSGSGFSGVGNKTILLDFFVTIAPGEAVKGWRRFGS